MNFTLSKTDDVLKRQFLNLQDRFSVAAMLEIDLQTLVFLLYRSQKNYYKEFSLLKKSGGVRLISAPISSLKILQQKLKSVLDLLYSPKEVVHGFTFDRNVASNASIHVKANVILNIDLEDFFPSINFGRVRGMFMARPYSLPPNAATVIAQICCYQGKLPQGAPTSPIISNMICAKLDSDLMYLARKYKCKYSRYADDITFSTNRDLSEDLAKVLILDGKRKVILGEILKNLIESNGFKINKKKTRVQYPYNRQEVTGVTVNEKVNVSRKFVRKVRAMLSSWEKLGYDEAQKKHFAKYDHRQRGYPRQTKFSDIVQGRISYIRMIKKEDDFVFRKLANKFYKLAHGYGIDKYPVTEFDDAQTKLWVIKCGQDQGSGFFLKDFGLITCWHVIKSGEPIQVYRFNEFATPYNAITLQSDQNLDLAILKVSSLDVKKIPQLAASKSTAKHNDQLTVCGFPHYQPGHKASVYNTQVSNFKEVGKVTRIIVKDLLHGGMSGGPVFNSKKEVAGVIVSGIQFLNQIDQTADYGIIPIAAIESLVRKQQEIAITTNLKN